MPNREVKDWDRFKFAVFKLAMKCSDAKNLAVRFCEAILASDDRKVKRGDPKTEAIFKQWLSQPKNKYRKRRAKCTLKENGYTKRL